MLVLRSITLYFALALATAGTAWGDLIDRVLVIVNDDVITEREFVDGMQNLVREIRSSGQQVPARSELERTVMERLILDRIQLQIADQWGIEVTDAQVQRAIETVAARQNLSLSEFVRRVRNSGVDVDAYQDEIRNQLRIQRVVDREVRQKLVVSDREIDREVQRLEAEQQSQEVEWDVSHILLTVDEGGGEAALAAARERAQSIVAEIREGASFDSRARRFSHAPDASDGGALGFRKPSQLPDLFAKALDAMQVGEVSDVMESPSGLHIVRLNATRGGSQQLIEQWQVRHILMSARNAETREAMAELNHLKTRIEQGEDFGELAQVHSDDPGSRIKGGDLGWISPGDTMPEFEEVVRNLKDDELSEPFQTRFGVHLVQVLDHRMQDVGQEMLRVQADRRIRQRKGREAYDAWLARIREEAYVRFRVKPN